MSRTSGATVLALILLSTGFSTAGAETPSPTPSPSATATSQPSPVSTAGSVSPTPLASTGPTSSAAPASRLASPPPPVVVVDDTLLTPPYVHAQPVKGTVYHAASPIQLEAGFFRTGSHVAFFLDSSATTLGSAVSEAVQVSGSQVPIPMATLRTSLPRGLGAGRHVIIARGSNVDARPVSVQQELQVIDVAPTLPATGRPLRKLAAAGSALLVLGLTIEVACRRRRVPSVGA